MADAARIFIDDLDGFVPPSGPAMPETGEREDWLARYNLAPHPIEFDNDPHSPVYGRLNVDETPGTILHYWFEHSADRSADLQKRMSLWFGGGFELDKYITTRFSDVVAKLASGEAQRWAADGPRERLAAIIALDQFSRSIFRNTPASFENDPIALQLTKDAIASGEDMMLKPVERWFLLMPLEHSESISDQKLSVEKFTELLEQSPPDLRKPLENALDYAVRHAKVIQKFGRFPHRNAILGRTTTTAEAKWLKKNPGGF